MPASHNALSQNEPAATLRLLHLDGGSEASAYRAIALRTEVGEGQDDWREHVSAADEFMRSARLVAVDPALVAAYHREVGRDNGLGVVATQIAIAKAAIAQVKP